MNNDNDRAPIEGCRCDVCRWAKARAERDADLARNYDRYLAGELVSRGDEE